MVNKSYYQTDTGDRLLEHYAALLVDKGKSKDLVTARTQLDVAGEAWYGLLGRMTEKDVEGGYSGRYVELRALHTAGIASAEETVEWRELSEVVVSKEEVPQTYAEEEGVPQAYDQNAEPLDLADTSRELTNVEDAELRIALWRLAEIKAEKAALEKEKSELNDKAVELQRKMGRPASFINPVTGKHQVANVIARENLEVDAGQLLAALIEYYGDEEQAEAIWAGVLKPREVDSKQGGLLEQAVHAHNDDTYNGVPRFILGKIGYYKPAAPYISFTNP